MILLHAVPTLNPRTYACMCTSVHTCVHVLVCVWCCVTTYVSCNLVHWCSSRHVLVFCGVVCAAWKCGLVVLCVLPGSAVLWCCVCYLESAVLWCCVCCLEVRPPHQQLPYLILHSIPTNQITKSHLVCV